jgi:cytochrome bd-type quinol oxidase subunit 2
MNYTLVYLGLLAVVLVVIVSAFVIQRTPDAPDIEARKIRFAAATFTGILMLLLFVAILYFVDDSGRGKDIFEKVLTALTPLGGVIVGYLFTAKKTS